MGYATQEDTKAPEPNYPNFEEAVKTYQEEVKQIQAEKAELLKVKAQIEDELGSLVASKSKLERDCASLEKKTEELGEQLRREVLQAEEEIEGKRSVLAADLDAREKQVAGFQAAALKEQDRLAKFREELAAKAEELGKRKAVIDANEADMLIGRGNLEELTEKTLQINAEALDLEGELIKKDAALKLVSEQLAVEAERQKKDKAELNQKAVELDTLANDLNLRAAAVSGLEEEQFLFKKTKADFEDARDRLAVREMAVAEAEGQVKNLVNDLKQREKLLAEKYKGE